MARNIAIFLAFTYALSLGGHLYSGDELMTARVAEAVTERGELSVRPIEGFEDYARVRGADGQSYTWYGIGLSIVAVPFDAAGAALASLLPESGLAAFDAPKVLYYDRTDRREVIRSFAVTFVNPIVTAATCGLLAAVLVRLGLSRRRAAAAALAYGLTGVTWFYGKTFFSEPLGALCLVGALAALLAMRDAAAGGRPALPLAFLAGLAAGGAVLSRVANGAVLLPAAAAFAWESARLGGGPKAVASRIAAAAAGCAVPLLLLLAANAARFGDPLETGYSGVLRMFGSDFLEGLAGLLVSPGRGLLLYFPFVLLAVPGLVALARRDPPLALFCGGSAVALLLLYAPWAQWDGGWVFGPRFLVPVLPLLAVPAALVAFRDRAWTAAAALLAFASFALAQQSIQVNYIDFHYAAWRSVEDVESAVRWSWEWSPVARYWAFPVRDFLVMPRLAAGEGGAALAALAWTLVAGWAASAAVLVRRIARG
jgi:hypothetical protein